MRRTVAEILINYLLGAAWAIALFGAVYLFWSFLPFGFLIAFIAAIFGSLPGLVIVVFLEVASLQFEKQRELKKQTHLMEAIRKELQNVTVCDN